VEVGWSHLLSTGRTSTQLIHSIYYLASIHCWPSGCYYCYYYPLTHPCICIYFGPCVSCLVDCVKSERKTLRFRLVDTLHQPPYILYQAPPPCHRPFTSAAFVWLSCSLLSLRYFLRISGIVLCPASASALASVSVFFL